MVLNGQDGAVEQALQDVNYTMAQQVLPDGVAYMGIPMDGKFHHFCATLHASASCISVAASYMQRLVRKDTRLAYLVLNTPTLEQEFGEWISPQQRQQLLQEPNQGSNLGINNFYGYIFMCVFIASKITDPIIPNLYTSVLSMLSRRSVEYDEALSFELHCLDLLDWRLGPLYYQHGDASNA